LTEPGSEIIYAALGDAEHVLASDLTLVECDRALIRAEILLRGTEISRRRTLLQTASARWTMMSLVPFIIERARRPFPSEPIKTLDALHLASALSAADQIEDLTVLSLDRRVRSSARMLGLNVFPVA